MDRAHRMGQRREVRVLRMVTKGSVDEAVHRIQQEKTQLDAKLLNGRRRAGGGEAEDEVVEVGAVDKTSVPDSKTISEIILEQLAAQQAGGAGAGTSAE